MHKIFTNSFWLLLDKVSKLVIGLVVIAKVAEHLGPAEFGIWNYCIALTTIVGVVATLGLEKIVVKELINEPGKKNEIIATAISLRVIAGVVSLIICTGIIYFTKRREDIYLYCTIILSLNLILQTFDVYDYYYQSQYLNKKIIIPRVTGFIIFSVIRIIFIYYNMQLIMFVWLSFWELLLTYIFIIYIYFKDNQRGFDLPRTLNRQRAKNLISQSWPLIFTGLAVVIYMKIDQLMLDSLSTVVQLGEYMAAVRISELWYAAPSVFSIALLPGLIKLKQGDIPNYNAKIEMWLRLSFWISILICIFINLFASPIIYYLYGAEFMNAAGVLKIHIWASIPVFLGIVITQYLLIENQLKVALYATLIGTIANVIANFLLIPEYGATGAAVSTVLSYSIVYLSILLLSFNSRSVYFSINIFNIKSLSSDFNTINGYRKMYFLKK